MNKYVGQQARSSLNASNSRLKWLWLACHLFVFSTVLAFNNFALAAQQPSKIPQASSVDGIAAYLEWDVSDIDLDLYLINPNGSECFYGNDRPNWGCIYDDDSKGYSTEQRPYSEQATIDLAKLEANPGEYRVEVRRWSRSSVNVTATIYFFTQGQLLGYGVYNIPPKGQTLVVWKGYIGGNTTASRLERAIVLAKSTMVGAKQKDYIDYMDDSNKIEMYNDAQMQLLVKEIALGYSIAGNRERWGSLSDWQIQKAKADLEGETMDCSIATVGKIYLNYEKISSDDELAAVLLHEMTHQIDTYQKLIEVDSLIKKGGYHIPLYYDILELESHAFSNEYKYYTERNILLDDSQDSTKAMKACHSYQNTISVFSTRRDSRLVVGDYSKPCFDSLKKMGYPDKKLYILSTGCYFDFNDRV